MNAHQRRKYIKANEPIVKRAIATLKIAGMPLRAAHLQRLVDEGEWLEAKHIAQAVVRGDLPHDDISPLQARRPSDEFRFLEQQIIESQLRWQREVKDQLRAFPFQASDLVDSALYAHAGGVRLQRSGLRFGGD